MREYHTCCLSASEWWLWARNPPSAGPCRVLLGCQAPHPGPFRALCVPGAAVGDGAAQGVTPIRPRLALAWAGWSAYPRICPWELDASSEACDRAREGLCRNPDHGQASRLHCGEREERTGL